MRQWISSISPARSSTGSRSIRPAIESINRLAVPSAIAAFLICWWWLRWLPGALLVFAVSVYCEVATISLIHWLGGEMSALLIVLPPLIQVVTVSGGIHLINYYLVAVQNVRCRRCRLGRIKNRLGSVHFVGHDQRHRFGFAISEPTGAGPQFRFVRGDRRCSYLRRGAGVCSRRACGLETERTGTGGIDRFGKRLVPGNQSVLVVAQPIRFAISPGDCRLFDRADDRAGLGNPMAHDIGAFANIVPGK